MYLLTLLAFYFHQVFELTDGAYQACRKKFGSKRYMWESFRGAIESFILRIGGIFMTSSSIHMTMKWLFQKKFKRVCRKHYALTGVTLAVPEGKIESNEEDKKVTG
jgi:hypothetical protein